VENNKFLCWVFNPKIVFFSFFTQRAAALALGWVIFGFQPKWTMCTLQRRSAQRLYGVNFRFSQKNICQILKIFLQIRKCFVYLCNNNNKRKIMQENLNTYRFTSDVEPTDEQLLAIMKEVEADVRRKSKENLQKIQENIQREYEKVQAMFQTTIYPSA
jgi:hypothetical protein